jgi:hypothetical protein
MEYQLHLFNVIIPLKQELANQTMSLLNIIKKISEVLFSWGRWSSIRQTSSSLVK